MKNVLLGLLILLVVAAVLWFIWINWGAQLSQLPGQVSALISRMLLGIFDSLAGFGRAVRDSFRLPAP